METKVKTKRAAAEKPVAKTKALANSPFESTVEAVPAKRRSQKEAVVTQEAEAVPVAKAPKKPRKAVNADPFAEVVETSSPVKKAAAKTRKMDAKAPKKAPRKSVKKRSLDVTAEIAAATPEIELSPTFKALAEIALPELPRENRARLQMQTPTRLYFYWSIRENPWQQIRNIFGEDMGSYELVLKLIDEKSGFEEIHRCEADGNFWFDVEPDGTYRAEIGFYATNRPYVRILYSNPVTTPRRSPSPHSAAEARWTVSANKFAEVLDVAGFSRDAFDVALAGDDHVAAEDVSHRAFSSFLGTADIPLGGVSAEDLRYALLALAAGVGLEELRFRVGASLFAILQANAGSLGKDKAIDALTEYYDIDESEFVEEQNGPAVYGASLVNFPRTLKTRSVSPRQASRYNPVSSHSIR